MRRGDIVWADLGRLRGREASDRRPVVIVSHDALNRVVRRLGRKRLLDTLLAASYRVARVSRVVTTDWRDVDVFGTFEVVRIGERAD